MSVEAVSDGGASVYRGRSRNVFFHLGIKHLTNTQYTYLHILFLVIIDSIDIN